MARPIEFVTKDRFARLGTVKNLGSFVSTQVLSALAGRVFPPSAEAHLLALRDLFIDFHPSLPQQEQCRRLQDAAVIIQALRGLVEHSIQQPEPDDVSERIVWQGPSKDAARQDLWKLPIRFVKGVGPKRVRLLRRLKIETVEDALWTVPWRYEDRSVVTPIGSLVPGAVATICGTIEQCRALRTRNRRMSVLDVWVHDQTGRLRAVFFNQPYLEKILVVGTRVMMSGRVTVGTQGWTMPRMDVAHYEIVGEETESLLHVGRIVPVYHETKGWTSRHMRVLEKTLLDTYARNLRDCLPAALRARRRLIPIRQALQEVHFPRTGTDQRLLEQGKTPAHRRLAFEELFLLQLALAARRRAVQEERKRLRFDPRAPLVEKLRRLLPFRLTAAQERVIGEIFRDMLSPRPMNRLVQGDVGSGKTAVALHAIVMACGSGYQAALMAPTEILAEQHHRNLSGMFESLGVRATLMRGGDKASVKKAQAAALASGEIQVAIGTHALIQKGVIFKNLALAVVDEQHKFGVLQRKMLVDKGYKPDVLVMTATPIPRTLAMTVYGDLDVSVIDMLPPGRKPVRTLLFGQAQRRRALQILRDELRHNRQAYIVYPLIEESENTDLQAAIQGAERLQREELAEFRVGLLHGRLKAAERESVMAEFKAGAIQVLVATTVVEVGLDVPNATVMMIEHAERFGLAQLHQLRGRVGRAGHQSYCVLMANLSDRASTSLGPLSKGYAHETSSAKERLEALVRSNDGFVIAEEDLRIRGPGELLGVRQWGVPEFRVADLVRDGELLSEARQEAAALLQADPALNEPAHRELRDAMLRKWREKLDLGSIS
ncbi:MAG: ATP-dependent DNA helicase RecG [Nitrospira sp.]|nr:ATP-dependent DNA helicase RecG [Nitrospira sp.]MCP9442545.1 ATP-dependent DNA helicase RecG [Nitrospira sp.]